MAPLLHTNDRDLQNLPLDLLKTLSLIGISTLPSSLVWGAEPPCIHRARRVVVGALATSSTISGEFRPFCLMGIADWR